ncbi:MAG: hypothetical protein N0C90_26330, partial [Candidatus Thiodiazotropha endolucinida]|nr:hypothetical protein [Candidatus Thiodiazotropha taylori]MCW4264866.1 hypothetical protein [Candidatus Thiodiazotropha endolucinida]
RQCWKIPSPAQRWTGAIQKSFLDVERSLFRSTSDFLGEMSHMLALSLSLPFSLSFSSYFCNIFLLNIFFG